MGFDPLNSGDYHKFKSTSSINDASGGSYRGSTPAFRAVKKKELEKYPLVRRCWKGYDFGLLSKFSEYGLINAEGRSCPALITRQQRPGSPVPQVGQRHR